MSGKGKRRRWMASEKLRIVLAGMTVSIAAQAALETLPTDEEGKLKEKPAIRSDNGSGYVSREFGGVLDEHGLNHRRITPHCPEENGTMERANRTIDEALEGEHLTNYLDGVKVLDKIIRWYNEKRLHTETRPIGIPTLEDKVIQRAVVMLLEPIYEQDFLDCSYGFRPGRSAHQVLESFRNQTMDCRGDWVLERFAA